MFDDKIPFKKLPIFNQLIKDYLGNSSENNTLPDYPEISHFENSKSSCDRSLLKTQLLEQNRGNLLDDLTRSNIERITDTNCFTVTTGHQLCLLTGPMYFINKICSTIALSNQLNVAFPEKKFVPLFWMATEDHDVEEINHFHLFGKKHEWNTREKGAVGRFSTAEITSLLTEIETNISLSVTAQEFLGIAFRAYEKPTLAEATRYLVSELFKGTGLIILDGDDRELKQKMIPFFERELVDKVSFEKIEATNKLLLSKGYKIQVNPREINLFYLLDNDRQRIIEENGVFKVNNTSLKFSKEEILQKLKEQPQNFSPNVIMRPLYQEVILPNVAYIGGGGEISYWLQLFAMFDELDVSFPQLIVRDSAVFVSNKNNEIRKKYQLTWADLFQDEAFLQKKVVQNESKLDFEPYLKEVTNFYNLLMDEMDKSLKGTIASEQAKALKGLKNIEKRAVKNLKLQSQTEINRVIKMKKQLFPSGKLQERYSNYLELLATFDKPLIPLMIKSMNPLEKNFHFYIEE